MIRHTLFVLALSFLARSTAAQTPAPPDPRVQQAQAALAAGDHDAAIATLEEVLGDDESPQIWLLLGRALRGRGDWEDAAGVFELIGEDPAVGAQATFEAARVFAEHGETEAALANVALALTRGFASPLVFERDPAFASLRTTDAFRELVPPLPPSSKCFLEEPRVLHTFYGEAAGDVFGWIGRDAGDCDGDGKHDLLLSAPFKALDGPSAGRIYVYSGATGELLFQRDGEAGEQLGIGIEAAGDVNGDGFADVLAGASGLGNPSAPRPGVAYVYSGKDGATVLELTRGVVGDELGRKLSGGVDFDGDGHDDLLVGAPGAIPASAGATTAGVALVYSGKDGSVLATLEGEVAGERFGVSNAVWSGAGRKLLAIGAGNAGANQGGRVSVFEWRDGAPRPHFTIEHDATSVALGGMFVAFVGDMTGDGVSEVYASDWQNGANGAQSGRIFVHDGASGEQLFTLTGDAPGIGFGTCTADVGDVTGDGLADLLVGAWQEPSGARGGGKCTLYAGGARPEDVRPIATYTCTVAGETLGFDTTGVGDLDGDGGVDFLVTGGYSPVAGFRAGRAFVIAGPMPDGSPSEAASAQAASEGGDDSDR